MNSVNCNLNQSWWASPYAQENHSKIGVLENIINDLLKFQSDHLFQGRITEVECILRECEWTDLLVRILGYGNEYVLLSHKYQIKMED